MGKRFSLELEWEEKKLSESFQVEVAWINPKKIGDLQPGMGLKFVDPSPQQRRFVQNMVHALIDKAVKK
jgi:Tfp pilus assembly protein PilZ